MRFTKQRPDGSRIAHEARVITYPDAKKRKLVSPLANDMETDPPRDNCHLPPAVGDRAALQADKAEFPLRYFYGESTDAIMIQIWVTLIANLLPMVMRSGLTRPWRFSGLATMVDNPDVLRQLLQPVQPAG